MDPTDFLAQKYHEAFEFVSASDTASPCGLTDSEIVLLEQILEFAERAKAVLTVLLTSVVYKALNPTQDIRLHQASLAGGYSGRGFDVRHITPFLKKQKFPAMAESGWLTRSLEQNSPYDKNYGGKIQPVILKEIFLQLLNNLEEGANAEAYLTYLLQGLILARNKHAIDLAKPVSLPIHKILDLLDRHFFADYKAEGAARLPVLALYAAYRCLMSETKRFEGKTLLPLESHTAADSQSGNIGDIEIHDESGRPFEAVEVKYGIPISLGIIGDAFEKFSTTQVERYYILSTANVKEDEAAEIKNEIEKIKNIHGCNVIVNGVMESVSYYLRLLQDTSEFIANYVDLVETDTALKFEHKLEWNKIISLL